MPPAVCILIWYCTYFVFWIAENEMLSPLVCAVPFYKTRKSLIPISIFYLCWKLRVCSYLTPTPTPALPWYSTPLESAVGVLYQKMEKDIENKNKLSFNYTVKFCDHRQVCSSTVFVLILERLPCSVFIYLKTIVSNVKVLASSFKSFQ